MTRCHICDADREFLRQGRRPQYEQIGPRIRIVDLFCGCGGLSLGLAEAARRLGFGIRICAAVDHDRTATFVYGKNFPGAKVLCSEVETSVNGALGAALTATEQRFAETVGKVDVLIGGPPCQGHSDLNNHTRRTDPRNALYTRMARAAAVLSPAAVLIENVPTVRHDSGAVVEVTKSALAQLKYSVHDAVLDLSILGAPQRRRRHVLLGVHDGYCDPQYLLETLPARCHKHPARSVSWAISDLLRVAGGIFNSASRTSQENAERISYLFERDLYDLPNCLRPECHHSDHSYRSMYGRLRWDKPAQTVTTGFGSMGQGRYIHPRRQRTITPHEAARLQMIPDFFDLSEVKSRGALATIIGNTVPPVLAAAVGQPVLRALFTGKNGSGKRSRE